MAVKSYHEVKKKMVSRVMWRLPYRQDSNPKEYWVPLFTVTFYYTCVPVCLYLYPSRCPYIFPLFFQVCNKFTKIIKIVRRKNNSTKTWNSQFSSDDFVDYLCLNKTHAINFIIKSHSNNSTNIFSENR